MCFSPTLDCKPQNTGSHALLALIFLAMMCTQQHSTQCMLVEVLKRECPKKNLIIGERWEKSKKGRTWGNGSILKEEGWERPQQEDERDRKITSSDRKRDGEGTDRWKSQLVMNKKKRK